ncbi:inositol monophosphatase family protein [Brevibacillus sp. NRS-1366]|uniref:inositol monophosphatase family protein n=1 Tax=Brevibacillus sp. NRS-1366 TaxID=3233899 RepID=UPI003D2586BA
MHDEALDWGYFADKIVRLAGQKIIGLRKENHIEVTHKNAGELVTSADLASDQIIREAITSVYPNHRILSEEECTDHVWGKGFFEGPLWIIDPLDGTVNFARYLPYFAISVALAVDGEVWAGAVHAPDLGVTYIGIRGKGAYCNGKQIHVHRFEDLSEAIIGTGFPHDKEKVPRALERVNLLRTHCRDIRRLAAPTMDICYVASSCLDAHTESLAPWDVAAAGLIAREAGAITGHIGVVPADFPQELYGEEVIYANPGIFEELLSLLRSKE